MTDRIKCIVKDCGNYTCDGGFVGMLCIPCHTFITRTKLAAMRHLLDEIRRHREFERRCAEKLVELGLDQS